MRDLEIRQKSVTKLIKKIFFDPNKLESNSSEYPEFKGIVTNYNSDIIYSPCMTFLHPQNTKDNLNDVGNQMVLGPTDFHFKNK